MPAPVEVRKDVSALSPSSASVLAQCPRRFELSKVLGRKEPPSQPATGGKFVHKVLELVTAHPPEERTVDVARPVASRLWADSVRAPGEPVEFVEADPADVVELRRDLAALRVDVRPFKSDAWAAIEYAILVEGEYGGEVAYREMSLWDTTVGGVPFRGYADRVDRHPEGLVDVDYKSGKSPTRDDGSVDQDKLNDKAEQLLWYWEPIEQKTGEKVVGSLLAYIGRGAQVHLWVDDRRLERAKDKLRRLWQALGSWERRAKTSGEPYPADAGWLCGWCPFWAECQDGSAFLLDKLSWADARPAKGKPLPSFRAEMAGWSRERREAWVAFARGRGTFEN